MKAFAAGSYVLNNREYKTCHGLMDALARAHVGASEISGVSSERRIKVYSDRSTVWAEYSVSKPEAGKPMFVEKML